MLFLEQSATHRYAVRARGLGNARRGFDAFGAITGGDGRGDKLAARAADVDDMHIAGRFAEQGRDACEPGAGDRLAALQLAALRRIKIRGIELRHGFGITRLAGAAQQLAASGAAAQHAFGKLYGRVFQRGVAADRAGADVRVSVIFHNLLFLNN